MSSSNNPDDYPNQALIPHPGGQIDLAPQDGWDDPNVTAVRAGQNPLILLPIGGQQLAPFCHNSKQHALLELPGFSVIIVRGSAKARQLFTQRPSYVNALLIASRGTAVSLPCEACRKQSVRASDGYSKPFPVCVKVPGHFGGCCAGCKFRDHAARCTVRDGGVDDPNAAPSAPYTQLEFAPLEPNQDAGGEAGEGSQGNLLTQ
ncbi:hypothetical protein F4781DRAFT_380096 [Annulohypoxylon bovei var. microspora]|nr:hypothetical protein F4781DRAFT_380096 [Annulohypoxylon bovei var. microspora]